MIKVLFLCDKKYWERKMSRVRFHAANAILNHKEIKGIKDGPGFPGWKDVPTSVKKHSPDIVFWFKPLGMKGYDQINVPRVISYNEMYNVESTADEITKSGSGLVICHLANDMPKFSHLSKKHKFINLSHCIEPSIFRDYEQKKVYDILLTGVMANSVYPLRTRIRNLVKDGKFANLKTKTLRHPGYRISDVNSQVISYAKELNKAKVVISCSSKYKYALAKYSEIPACNSLLIADIPDERQAFFNKFIVPIDMSFSDDKIINTIKKWVRSDKEREERTKLGMELTVARYTQAHYAERFHRAITRYLSEKNSKVVTS
jgi:hypothetical protein